MSALFVFVPESVCEGHVELQFTFCLTVEEREAYHARSVLVKECFNSVTYICLWGKVSETLVNDVGRAVDRDGLSDETLRTHCQVLTLNPYDKLIKIQLPL